MASMPVEPVINFPKAKKNLKRLCISILINGTPHVDAEEIIAKCENVKSHNLTNDGKETVLEINFDNESSAIKAQEDLKQFQFKYTFLKMELQPAKQGTKSSGKTTKPFVQRIPLRMLVSTQYVGAIIGKTGICVKNIATKCKARIDVHSKDTAGGAEKVISIYGQPENRTEACKQILQVLCAEGAFSSKNEVVLRLLAGDEYSGRLIGKEGKHIKKVRELSNSKINIVVPHELSSFYPDRVVMIKGSLSEVVAAEGLISKKLASCYETDAAKSQSLLNSNIYLSNKSFKMLTPFFQSNMKHPCMMNGMYPFNNFAFGDGFHQTSAAQYPAGETLKVTVPNSAVGSLIGTEGSIIKQMIRSSGASLSVERKDDKAVESNARLVCIRGDFEACIRALFQVFERLRFGGFSMQGESRLKVMMNVPADMVGRLIGREGCHIKIIEKFTGAIVRVAASKTNLVSNTAPDAGDNSAAKGDSNQVNRPETAANKNLNQVEVQFYGNFASVLSALYQVKNSVTQSLLMNLAKVGSNGHHRVYYNNTSKPQRNKNVK